VNKDKNYTFNDGHKLVESHSVLLLVHNNRLLHHHGLLHHHLRLLHHNDGSSVHGSGHHHLGLLHHHRLLLHHGLLLHHRLLHLLLLGVLHLWGRNEGLVLGLFLGGFGLLRFIFMGHPVGRQVNLTDGFVVLVEVPPIIDTLVNAHSRDLDSELTNELIGGHGVLSPDFEGDVISNVLNINFEDFLPGGVLAFSISGLGSELLHSGSDLDVGVHAGEGVHVLGKSGLVDVEVKSTGGGTSVAGGNGDRSSSVGVSTTHLYFFI
jgi:hypothetical protein